MPPRTAAREDEPAARQASCCQQYCCARTSHSCYAFPCAASAGPLSLLLAPAAGSGTQCVIPYRGDDMAWRHLKVMGDLGVVAPMPFHPRDMDSIRRATEGSDIVINLIGKVRARARAAASAAASGVDAERASGFSPPAHA